MNLFSKLFTFGKPRTQALSSPAEIASHIQSLLPNIQSGTLRFWDIWFGKPYDNVHTIQRAEAEGDCLKVFFEGGETLTVWHPAQCQIDANSFVIYSATQVLWQWYYYGRCASPGNLMYHKFKHEELSIRFETNFYPESSKTTPNIHAPAVRMY